MRRNILCALLVLAASASAQDDFDTSWVGYEASSFDRPWVADVADLDGDGDPDMLVSNFWFYARIGVSLNQGDGSFGPPAHYANGQDGLDGSLGVLAADFNGDGFPDVVVSNTGPNWNGSTVSVLLNQGDATFGPFQKHSVGSGTFVGPVGLEAADFNQDGALDLAVANYGWLGQGKSIAVLSGDGNGGFGPPVSILVGSSPYRLAAGDLDQDGRIDLVVAREGPPAAVSVLMNTGAGFAPFASYPGGAGSFNPHPSVVLSDVDLDGDLDVLYGGDRFDLFRNQGDGSLGPAVDLGIAPHGLAAGDVTGDGWPDVLGAHGSNDNWTLRVNNGEGGFLPEQTFVAGEEPMDVELVDADGDGDLDPIILARFSRETAVHRNPGDGDFTQPPAYSVSGLGSPYELADAGDVDGDGDLDLVSATPGFTGGGVAVLKNQGDGTYAPAVNYSSPQPSIAAKLADLDGDSDLDLVWADSFPPYNFKTRMNLGDGTYGPLSTWPSNTCGNTGLGVFDVDGDADADVVLLEGLGCGGGTNGGKRLYISRNKGDGTFDPPYIVVTAFFPEDVVAGDFDGDSVTDIAAVGAQLAIHLGSGDGAFQPKLTYSPSGDRVAAADLDGDGDLDLATSGGESVWVYLGNGDGTFVEAVTYNVSPFNTGGARAVAIGDVDGDGDGDLLVANAGSHDVSLLRNNGNGSFQPQIRYGAGEDPLDLLVADFTGNSRLDLAVLGSEPGTQITTAFTIVAGKGPAAWTSLGSGLAGTHGVPVLLGSGSMVGGGTLAITLSGALQLAPVTLVIGLAELGAAFKGGVMVPAPLVLIGGLVTDATGGLSLGGTLPAATPSGFMLFLQAWIADGAGPVGFAASNGLKGTTP